MSEDGQPDEAKEWEDLEGIEQNMYPSDAPCDRCKQYHFLVKEYEVKDKCGCSCHG